GGVDGGGLSSPFTQSPLGMVTASDTKEEHVPEAYLNYILMDTLGVFIEAGFIQMTEAAREDGSITEHEKLELEHIASQDGYLYTFVSHESDQPKDVFFDDLTMTLSAADQLYFFSKDHLGSTRVLIRDDNSVVARYDYDVYGQQIRYEGSETTAYKYTGQEFDQRIGLYNFRARFYDNELGRF
ncbi:MAG: RHS repeat-associated core domain-containing protein, partial [Bacteroidota bacterium]